MSLLQEDVYASLYKTYIEQIHYCNNTFIKSIRL